LRVTASSVQMTPPLQLDLEPLAAGGGRVGIAITLPQVRLFADGRSDFGGPHRCAPSRATAAC
jgi:hypothetical protein